MGALYSRSEEETERLGERLGKLLRPGDVVAFTGEWPGGWGWMSRFTAPPFPW